MIICVICDIRGFLLCGQAGFFCESAEGVVGEFLCHDFRAVCGIFMQGGQAVGEVVRIERFAFADLLFDQISGDVVRIVLFGENSAMCEVLSIRF